MRKHLPRDKLLVWLYEIGVLKRREIEARVVGSFVAALALEFDRERTLSILSATIIDLARRQGAERAAQLGDDSLLALANSAGDWRKGDALEIEPLELTEARLAFNVFRCRYAEMLRQAQVGPSLRRRTSIPNCS